MSDSDDDELTRARLNMETGRIAWTELQRFFAGGRAIRVAPHLDLVEVALVIERDRADQLARWTERAEVGPVSDDDAREWLAANALMWSVVVKPWVLVQPIVRTTTSADDSG